MKLKHLTLFLVFLTFLISSCATQQTTDVISTKETKIEEKPTEKESIEEPATAEVTGNGAESCLDNLDRFSGTYLLSVKSRELGVQDYSTQGEEICGTGEAFFGDLPTNAIISVSGRSASMNVNINSELYSGSGTFQGPSAPKKPLVSGTFYDSKTSVSPGVNSCGTKSPYFSFSKKLAEDGGQTSLTAWVYGQEDAINIVVESFWIADDSEILSPCHGVIIFQGTK